MSRETLKERLIFLKRIAVKEADLLSFTANRLFEGVDRVTPERVKEWTQDNLIAEQLDAFVARFGRLQDTLGDKLLPQLLEFLGEPKGAAIDNLDKAERFGWIESSENWLLSRQLRNQMIHEYIEDPEVLADALHQGKAQVSMLTQASQKLVDEVSKRAEDC
ncbi:hypothetical protein [Marinospirillum perlucidum]|uniref:hypothetical protein n=1 Tax=Marinospirillum perlucidum TaxID=1982602 RepID=UPI000DF234BF|nr:hypothetical protein [Marinospirillum perlucidum]